MDKDDRVYIRLQRHLDRQPVGLPATRSRAEMRILKHIFTPQQAEVATYLSYKFEPLDAILPRVKHVAKSAEELSELLDAIQKNGGIETRTKDGRKEYCNAPLVVGMYELQGGRLTPDFLKDIDHYTGDMKFGAAFLGTELPQMRTIPIAESISPESRVCTYDEVAVLVQQADAPYRVFECICRKKKSMQGETCKVTDRKETCLAFGSMAESASLSGWGREIGRDEMMSILQTNQKQGLVLQPSNTEKAEFICSCCGCCCGMLGVQKTLPKPLDYWASNFNSAIDTNVCDGCGACEVHCQVGAIKVPPDTQLAVVNLNRCIGCGVCVSVCPKKAVSLQKKLIETRPPKTREELYDIIMANRKGTLGRWAVMGKLVFDAITTGQTQMLKQVKQTKS